MYRPSLPDAPTMQILFGEAARGAAPTFAVVTFRLPLLFTTAGKGLSGRLIRFLTL
jgi:hypothetical protein